MNKTIDNVGVNINNMESAVQNGKTSIQNDVSSAQYGNAATVKGSTSAQSRKAPKHSDDSFAQSRKVSTHSDDSSAQDANVSTQNDLTSAQDANASLLNSSNTEYGYIRVSTREQNEARQIDALREFGIDTSNIFMDKQSGKDFNRPAYQTLLGVLKPGDTLVVKSIDRLGRNYDEILEQWRLITKEKGCAIVVLDMPLLDTRNKRDLTGTLISDIVLQLLSYVAETERRFIKQRQAEGIAAAKARGQRFGRPPMDRGPEFEDLKAKWKDKKISAAEAGRIIGVSHVTFLKWVRED